MRPPLRSSPGRQRGATTLLITLLLLFALLLGTAFASRDLIFEQRTSANQYRSTQAFEAAEAGLEWALAQLNTSGRLDAGCQPTQDAGANRFRERYLRHDRATSMFAAATWNDAGVASALQPSCVLTSVGWACSCPTSGPPALATPDDGAVAAAFTLHFHAGAKPGLVRVVAVGCSRLAAPCAAGAARADSSAQIEVVLALLPGLRSAPAAALTTRGAVVADSAAFGAHNRDVLSGGTAIHAGGAIAASRARLSSPAGAATVDQMVSHDAALAGLDAARFFTSYFGIDQPGWMRQPAALRLSCSGNCAAALQRAIAAGGPNALIAVDGELLIEGPVLLGTAEQPVIIVASGAAQLRGAVALTGVIHAATLAWSDNGGRGALLRGAAISAGSYQGDGTPEFVYDAAVLAQLNHNSGSFVRVNGSWRDF